MDVISLIASLAGLAISAWALWSARSAKALAQNVLEGRDQHEDVERAVSLVKRLRGLNSVLMRRIPRNSDRRARGKPLEDDVTKVREMLDGLRTSRPLDIPHELQLKLDATTEEFERGLLTITDGGAGRNGWLDIQGAAQNLIPELESYSRQTKKRLLLERG